MSKEKKTMRDLVNRHQEIATRIGEIAATCETENRTRNEAEETEYRALLVEQQMIEMRTRTLTNPGSVAIGRNNDELLRSRLIDENAKVAITLVRDLNTTEALEGTGIIPVQENEMLKPLREGLIYDKVGIKVATGLPGQTLRWPTHGKTTAKWANEGERAEDSKIDFSKLETKPVRLTCAVPVTREMLESSHGVVESVVSEEMPASVIDHINEAMFSVTGKYKDKAGAEKDLPVVGPFASTTNIVEFAGAVPTRKELIKMKSLVAGSGIDMKAPCWVMTENMKAELEDTKVDAGSGRFVCENDTVLGYPVFTSHYIGEGNVGFGDWGYQAAGFFGAMSLVADPYTLARENSVDFVLNTHFGTATLYPEAFALGKVKAAPATGKNE